MIVSTEGVPQRRGDLKTLLSRQEKPKKQKKSLSDPLVYVYEFHEPSVVRIVLTSSVFQSILFRLQYGNAMVVHRTTNTKTNKNIFVLFWLLDRTGLSAFRAGGMSGEPGSKRLCLEEMSTTGCRSGCPCYGFR